MERRPGVVPRGDGSPITFAPTIIVDPPVVNVHVPPPPKAIRLERDERGRVVRVVREGADGIVETSEVHQS